VTDTATTSSSTQVFEELRTSEELATWRARLDDHVTRRPDKTLAFKSRMPLLYGDEVTTATAYTCPMCTLTSSGPSRKRAPTAV
jgi:hypothetical protein